MIGLGAMPGDAAITTLVGGDTVASMEDLNAAFGCAQIDLLAD
jgi:hypothetical protein